MKKRTIIGLLVVACSATMCFVGGTFAKYTSTATGSDKAIVAKWAFKQGNDNITNTISFDLFDKTKISDLNEAGNVPDSLAQDTHVRSATGDDAIIAPGTCGKVSFDLSNDSDVIANYALTFTATNASNIPLKFSKDNSTWVTSLDGFTIEGTLDISGTASSSTVSVYWKWDFSGDDVNDAKDTELGVAGTATYEINASCTFTQVD